MQNWQPSPQEAAQEILSRRAARKNLLPFIEYTKPDYTPAPHHRLICEALEAIERGETDRLAIFCPPRHGKSEIASRRFPAWYIGRNPTRQIICASYSAELATDFGRDVRNIVGSKEFGALFPVSLSADSQAADRWHTSDGGMYVAAGIGGSLTGRGAHAALIDDPVKDQQDADSETIRERTWNWYVSVLRTRLMPQGAIVLIQTRWNDDDLAGRILNSKEAARWHVIELPALKDGQALWPESYPVEELESIRALDERKFSALYQQQPQPDEGTYFKREWFPFVKPDEAAGHAYSTGDFAVTEGDGDYTEIATHKYGGGFLTLAVEGWRGQTSSDVWIDRMCDQFGRHKPLCFFGETGPIRRAIEPYLTRRMRERGAFCRLEWLTRGHDKPTMARGLQAMAASGRVRIADTEYGHALLEQLLRFPVGKYDDGVDMAALMGLAIDQAHPAVVAAAKPAPVRDGYTQRREEDSWRVA